MTTSEVKFIVTELDDIMKMHHLKDALPKIKELRSFCSQMYKEMKEEELEILNDEKEVSEDSEPHTSDEEFVAGEGEIDYASESSLPDLEEPKESSDSEDESDSEDSSDCECEEGCACQACKYC